MMVYVSRFGIFDVRGINEGEDELEVVQQELGIMLIGEKINRLFEVVDEKKFMLGVIKYGTLYHRVTTIDK